MQWSRASELSRRPFSGKKKKTIPIQKNVVITKLFAPKFCAECTGRDLHSSHGDPFREKSKIRPRSNKMSSSQSCSHRNSVQNAPIESSTALAATLFVNISLFKSLGNFWETSGRPSGNLWGVRNDFETLAQKTRFLKTGEQ